MSRPSIKKVAYFRSRYIKKEFLLGSGKSTAIMKTLEVSLYDPKIITIGSNIPMVGDTIDTFQFDGKWPRLVKLGGTSTFGKFRCFRNPEVVIDFPLVKGKKWTTELCGRRPDGRKVTALREVLGEETLVLPYGKVEGAIGIKTKYLDVVDIDYYTKDLGWIASKGKDLKGKWHWTFRLSCVQKTQ